MSRSTLTGRRMISVVGATALVSSVLVTASATPAFASHRVTPSVGVHPHVISQSFGEDESCVDPKIERAQHSLFQLATAKGITLIASAGDDGSAQLTCDGSTYHQAASSPATDPLVLGIGGTHLLADPASGAYQSESVWNESDTFGAAGGGGYSQIYKRPGYQDGFSRNRGRGVPDVSYNAAIDGGVLVNWGTVGGGFYLFGGTSSGSPQWAGLTALADQVARHRIGFINDALYRAGRNRFTYGALFHDVTVGNNSLTDVVDPSGNTVSVPGFPATKGWDASTGLGTPEANNLVPYLAFAG